MQAHLDDFVELHMHSLAWAAIKMLPGKRTDKNTRAVTSSGSSVVVIPLELDYILQVFRDQATYQRIKDFCTAVAQHSELTGQKPNLVPCAEFMDTYNCVKFKKIVPLNHLMHEGIFIDKQLIDIKQLKADIYETLQYLKDAGVSHGDPSLDNIGILNGKYVLFDYDKCGNSENHANDVRIFEKSLKSNGY